MIISNGTLIMTLANNPTNDNQHHRGTITTTKSKFNTITFPQWDHNIIGYWREHDGSTLAIPIITTTAAIANIIPK